MSVTNIETALQGFLSSDNNLRKQAEEFLNNVAKTNFDEGIQQFLQGMGLEQEEVAQLSAVYLKKKYLDDSDMISKLNEQHITTIITTVQGSVNGNRSYAFLQRSFEILVKLYSFAKKEEQIMDLIKSLSANSTEAKIKRSLMYMIEITCEYSFNDELLLKYSGDLSSIFQKYLEDSEIQVRVSAFRSLTVFLNSIEKEELLKKFNDVFPILLSKCVEALQQDSESGQKNLESLVDLCGTHPKFVRPIFNELVNLYTEVFSNKQFDDAIRVQAFSGIQLLCTTNPNLIRKSEFFQQTTVKNLMVVMSEIENVEIDEWNKELNDELLSQQHPSLMAIEVLGAIAIDLGVKFLLGLFIGMIREAISSQSWQQQHAGLMAISMLTEGCKDVFGEELDNIFQMVHSLSNSTNPRIISALLKTYGFLAEEFNPEFQEKYGAQVIPYIVQNLSHELIKVQYTAVQSMVTFARSDEESKIIAEHSTNIFNPLTTLFQKGVDSGNNLLLEEVLTCLSVLASAIGTEFSKHYNLFMPGLQKLLESIPTQNQTQVNIRVLTLESMGYLISSIKKDQALFVPEATKLMEVLLKMSQMYKQDDAHHSAIYVVMGQIVEGLGQDFAQYVPQIFDRIISSMEHEDIAKLGDEAQEAESSNVIKKNLDLGMFGNFNIQLNQVLLEQKIEGAHLLHNIAKFMGKAFFQYAEKTLAIISKNFSFRNSTDFRETCIKTLNCVLLSCETDEQMATIMNTYMPKLLEEFETAVKLRKDVQMAFITEQIAENLKIFRSPLVNVQFVQDALTKSSKALEVGEALKKQLRSEYADEEMDQEMQESLDADLFEVNAVMRGVIEVIGSVIETYNTQIEGIMINSIMPHFHTVLQSTTASENEVFNALYVFDVLLEYCSQETFNKAYPEVAKLYIALLNTQSYNTADILTNLVSGFSVFAKRCDTASFNVNYQDMMAIIKKVFEHPQKTETDFQGTLEAANGAVGRIAMFQLADQAEVRGQLATQFLQSLPFRVESEEAQQTHLVLLEQVLNKNQALFAQEQLLKEAITNINNLNQSNPELEILCDKGKTLLSQVLSA